MYRVHVFKSLCFALLSLALPLAHGPLCNMFEMLFNQHFFEYCFFSSKYNAAVYILLWIIISHSFYTHLIQKTKMTHFCTSFMKKTTICKRKIKINCKPSTNKRRKMLSNFNFFFLHYYLIITSYILQIIVKYWLETVLVCGSFCFCFGDRHFPESKSMQDLSVECMEISRANLFMSTFSLCRNTSQSLFSRCFTALLLKFVVSILNGLPKFFFLFLKLFRLIWERMNLFFLSTFIFYREKKNSVLFFPLE